jgi:putative ABC transport system permease protein
MKVCSAYALVSIVISSIGLFGLILFYTRRKMKEIGMRKVLGFSTMSLYYTLSSGFIRLLLVSVALACPAAYYVYKTLPSADKYAIRPGIHIRSLIIFCCPNHSYQIIKAVRTKAVDVLKMNRIFHCIQT